MPSPRHSKIRSEATKSPVHSGADAREATGFTHQTSLILLAGCQSLGRPVPVTRKSLVRRRSLLCTVEQTLERPQASLILLAGCQSLGCPSVHRRSGAEAIEATGFTHLAGWLPVSWVPSPRHKKIQGEATIFLRIVGQRPERPQASLTLVAGCRSFGCPAPGTRKSVVRRRSMLCKVEQRPERPQGSLIRLHSFCWLAASPLGAQPLSQKKSRVRRRSRLIPWAPKPQATENPW